jgi:endonuclease III
MPELVHALRAFYGPLPRPPSDLFQFFVWETISHAAVPGRRDLAWQALKRIPALTPDALFRVSTQDLSELVTDVGPHGDTRLERLRTLVGEFRRHREALDRVPLTRGGLLGAERTLLRLVSVDRDVRHRAHLFALGFLVLPIDIELERVVLRLRSRIALAGPTPARSGRAARGRRTARRWLGDRLPRDLEAFREAVLFLRHHAGHTCLATGPHCHVCPLRAECPSGG